MDGKISLINSIWNYKCPRCRKGDLFTSPFQFSKPLDMPAACKVCGQTTLPAPGFYYGSMFLSYIVTGFLYLGIVGLGLMVFKWTINQTFAFLLIFVALTYFRTARLSRSLWIHIMVKYQPE